VDFISLNSDEDELFHIFCPGSMFVEFVPGMGWKAGAANVPWGGEANRGQGSQ
jgi:hypothetical protein